PATEAGLDNGDIYTFIGEIVKSHRDGYFKERRVDGFYQRFMTSHKINYPLFTYRQAINKYALPEINQMRRGIQPGFITCFLEYAGQRMAGASLAIGAGYMH